MKKILAVVLALTLCMTLFAACSSNTASGSSSSSAAQDAESSESSESSDASEASETTGEKQTLVMATNAAFPPYEYYENDQIVGIDAEIFAAIAEKLGMDYSIEDMEFDSIITAVTSGKVDVGMAGMTVTDERKQSVSFTDSYATGKQVVIVKEGSPITSVDDLFVEGNNYIIGVQNGTTGDLYTTWDLEDEGLATIERYSKGADAVLALTSGKVDCVVIDNEPAKVFVSQNEGLTILETEYVIEDYAIAVAKDNTELLDQINTALAELIADGTVQSILDKYITAE